MKARSAFALTVLLIITPMIVIVADVVTYARANRSTNTMISRGERREYSLYVPASYDRSRPAPLVISIHGGAMWPAAQQDTSQWNRVADRHGFIVVYPSGRTGRGPRSTGPHDVPYIADLIDEIERNYNIDRSRIFANGFSNGGGTSFVLSCTLADRIAAVGLVDAAHLEPWSSCKDQRPVPMISFHGTADTAAIYEGGKTWVTPEILPNIPAWTALWGRRNGCSPMPVATRIAADVTRTEYVECAGNASAILYTVEGGGHTWPGGGYVPEWFVGKSTHSIDASSLMWEFFSQHPLPAK
jgi:polyhydroxybutyrate depolymerase